MGNFIRNKTVKPMTYLMHNENGICLEIDYKSSQNLILCLFFSYTEALR